MDYLAIFRRKTRMLPATPVPTSMSAADVPRRSCLRGSVALDGRTMEELAAAMATPEIDEGPSFDEKVKSEFCVGRMLLNETPAFVSDFSKD